MAKREQLKAPFPWFGGKSRVADLVWSRLGDAPNYVEPFFGSGAVLLNRPHDPATETINDKDGYLSNFWRSVQSAPDEVAKWADWPVNENDLHARHAWLMTQKDAFVSRLEGDPDFYDAKIAGWWVWGICSWIGSGWCSGNGPWQSVDGKLVHLGDAGRGVNRQRVHLGDAGRGVNRQLGSVQDWFRALSARLRRIRVCCGDWKRVCGFSPTTKLGLTGMFLDPPYDLGERADCYSTDEAGIAERVRQWCMERGNDPLLRIALCGYSGEHDILEDLGWLVLPWKTSGGYANQGSKRGRENASRERIWFSPHCLKPEQSTQVSLWG